MKLQKERCLRRTLMITTSQRTNMIAMKLLLRTKAPRMLPSFPFRPPSSEQHRKPQLALRAEFMVGKFLKYACQ